jgi:hypothetical protein
MTGDGENPPLLVVHSTEGYTAQSAADWMRSQNTMSNAVYDPRTRKRIQLLDWHRNARSLRNEAGGVETNNRPNVFQLEIVGFAKAIPNYPDEWFRNLGDEIERLIAVLNLPRNFPAPFLPYPASFGKGNGVRLTAKQWATAGGIVGHQHVPENDHGDPGDLSRLIPLITPGVTPTMSQPDHTLSTSEVANLKEMQRMLRVRAGYAGAIDARPGTKTLEAVKRLDDKIDDWIDDARQADSTTDDARLGAAIRPALDLWFQASGVRGQLDV